MAEVQAEVNDLLLNRPEVEEDLRSILTVDARQEHWSFDEVPADSGTFGELVSRGIVEQAGTGYRVADRTAVRRGLDGEATSTTADRSEPDGKTADPAATAGSLVEDIDRIWVGSLLAALALVVMMRTVFTLPSVMRGDDILLLANDPYYYRHAIETVLETGLAPGGLPEYVKNGEGLLIFLLSVITALLGGGSGASGIVTAWYPVVAAVLAALLVAAIGYLAFDDRRVAVAAVAVYAILPLISYRSGLGFGDHHAFDYLLVALTMASLLALIRDQRPWRRVTRMRIAGSLGLILGVAGHVHAWDGGPLLILPIGAYLLVKSATDVRAGDAPLQANAWVIGSLFVAAALAYGIYALFGWSGTFRSITPFLLFVGGVGVTTIAEGARRYGLRSRTLLSAELTASGIAGVIIWTVLPSVRRGILDGLGFVTSLSGSTITETQSLFSPANSIIGTPFFHFGFPFYVALIVLAWLSWRSWTRNRPAWIVLSAYTLVFLAASALQVRFAGQMAAAIAVLTGFGFVYLLAAVDITPSPIASSEEPPPHRQTQPQRQMWSLPSARTGAAIVGLFLLICGLNFLFVPELTGNLTVPAEQHQTAEAIDDHAAAANITWPENYVLSSWGDNRFYNYHVSGESQSYSYAQSNYMGFLTGTQARQLYQGLRQKPVGYVVVTDDYNGLPARSMQMRLWNWGSYTNGVPGLEHFRVIHASNDTRVHQLVPGAILVGKTTPNTTALVETSVTVNNHTHPYQRQIKTSEAGLFAIRVSYPGTYQVGDTQITVPESAVTNGDTVTGPSVNRTATEVSTS